MIRLTVFGMPAPQGSKKFVGTTKEGRGILVESSKKVKPWRMDVKAAAEGMMQGKPAIDGPITVLMTFTLPKPASAPKTKRTYPDRMPDLSKLVRSTEDALTDAGVWADDARIITLVASKVYPGEGMDALQAPGAVIEVHPFGQVAVEFVDCSPEQPSLLGAA